MAFVDNRVLIGAELMIHPSKWEFTPKNDKNSLFRCLERSSPLTECG